MSLFYNWLDNSLYYDPSTNIIINNEKAIELIKEFDIKVITFLCQEQYIAILFNDVIPVHRINNIISEGLIGYKELYIDKPSGELLELIYNLDKKLLNSPIKAWIEKCKDIPNYMFDKHIMSIILGYNDKNY